MNVYICVFNNILVCPVPGSHAAEANWTDALKRSAQTRSERYIPALKLL